MSTFDVLQAIGWIGNILSLVGAYQITHRRRSGYVFFILSCLLLMPPVLYAHVWNQAALFATYLVIDFIGLARWGKNG